MSFAHRVKAKVLTMSYLALRGLAPDQLSSLTAYHVPRLRPAFYKHTPNSELLRAFVLSQFISVLLLQLFMWLVPFRSQWTASGRLSVTFPHSVSVTLRRVTMSISFRAFSVVRIDLVYLLTVSHHRND